jgi:branched-chain amino acid transport system substrate-binding protein
MTIDPELRDVVQDIYIRKCEKKDGKLWNIEIDKLPQVKPT